MTPLHYAARDGHLSVVEHLIIQKADINAKSKDDLTPLHYAASYGHLSIVNILFKQNSDKIR